MLLNRPTILLAVAALKSPDVDVTAQPLTLGSIHPTPTHTSFLLSRVKAVLSKPMKPVSMRPCVWRRSFSITPVSRMMTRYPASAALLISPI